MLSAFFEVKQSDKQPCQQAKPRSKLDKIAAATKKSKKPPVAAASGDTQKVYAQFVPLPEETGAPRWADPTWASSDPQWSDFQVGSLDDKQEWDYVWDEVHDEEEEEDDTDEWSESSTLGTTSLTETAETMPEAPPPTAELEALDRHFLGRSKQLVAVPGSAAVAVYTGPELCLEDDDFIY